VKAGTESNARAEVKKFYLRHEEQATLGKSFSTSTSEYFAQFVVVDCESYTQVSNEKIQMLLGQFQVADLSGRDPLPLVQLGPGRVEFLNYRLPQLKGYQFWKGNPSSFSQEFPEIGDIALISSTGSGKVSRIPRRLVI
jgi:hypothetical protein